MSMLVAWPAGAETASFAAPQAKPRPLVKVPGAGYKGDGPGAKIAQIATVPMFVDNLVFDPQTGMVVAGGRDTMNGGLHGIDPATGTVSTLPVVYSPSLSSATTQHATPPCLCFGNSTDQVAEPAVRSIATGCPPASSGPSRLVHEATPRSA